MDQVQASLKADFPIWRLLGADASPRLVWDGKAASVSGEDLATILSQTDIVQSTELAGATFAFVTKDRQTVLLFSAPGWSSACEKPLRRLVQSIAKRLLRA